MTSPRHAARLHGRNSSHPFAFPFKAMLVEKRNTRFLILHRSNTDMKAALTLCRCESLKPRDGPVIKEGCVSAAVAETQRCLSYRNCNRFLHIRPYPSENSGSRPLSHR